MTNISSDRDRSEEPTPAVPEMTHCTMTQGVSASSERDFRTLVRENGTGNDERPATGIADRSSRSDSRKRKEGVGTW